jgi:hypothetical protein
MVAMGIAIELGKLSAVAWLGHCAISVLVGGIVILGEAAKWLDTDVWQTQTLRDGLVFFWGPSVPYAAATGQLGLDEMINWALGTPFALWLILILPLTWLFAWVFTLDNFWFR